MITLTPAYGRDYVSKKKVLADWNSDRDFIINEIGNPYDGKPANKPQFQGETVKFRYARLTKVFVVKA